MQYLLRFVEITIFVAFSTNAHDSNSQRLTIEGVISDAVTKEALPFSSVFIQDRQRGTVSNREGRFYLNLNDWNLSDTLVISHIGYQLYKVPLANYEKFSNEFVLLPASQTLAEIVVTPLTAKEQVVRAAQSIDSLFVNTAFLLQGHYLEEVTQEGVPIMGREAVLNVYRNQVLDSLQQLQIEVIEGRELEEVAEPVVFSKRLKRRKEKMVKKFKKQTKKDTTNLAYRIDSVKKINIISYFLRFGGPYRMIRYDPVRYFKKFQTLDKKGREKYTYKVAGHTYYQDRSTTIIELAYRKSPETKRRLYISSDDEIMRYEYERPYSLFNTLGKTALFLMGYALKDSKETATVYYRNIQKKWYTAYLNYRIDFVFIDKHLFRPNDKINYRVQMQFISEKIQKKGVDPIPKEKQINTELPFTDQLGEYHPEFWKTYKRNQSEDKE